MLFGSSRLDKLEEQVRSLKRMVEERDLDWVDMRSRCKRLLDRTEKAARYLQEKAGVESQEHTEDAGNGAGSTSHGRLLTPHQLEIQQLILKRRGGA